MSRIPKNWKWQAPGLTLALVLASLMVATAPQPAFGAAAEGDTAKKSSKAERSSGGWKGADLAKSPAAPPVANDYTIGPGDVLSIQVWHEPDISRIVPVRPDGRITLPLIGEVEAQGSTTADLRSRIAEKLQAYVAHPEVAVIVQEVRSPTFNVVGQVVRPGAYTLLKPLNVLDAIALAGGFSEFARAKKIYVLRKGRDGSTHKISFNYNEVIEGKNEEQNVTLKPGDTVVVP